jgi:hypothetical protein
MKEIFQNAVDTIFDVFESLKKSGTYLKKKDESGWGDDDSPTEYEFEFLEFGLVQEETKNLSFYTKITPEDLIIIIKGKKVEEYGLKIKQADSFKIGEDTYLVEAHEGDPANASFVILLRK